MDLLIKHRVNPAPRDELFQEEGVVMPNAEERVHKAITKDTFVSLAVLISVVGAAVTLMKSLNSQEVAFQVMKAEFKGRLDAIEVKLDQAMHDRWSEDDMQRWADDLKAKNPSLIIPRPEMKR